MKKLILTASVMAIAIAAGPAYAENVEIKTETLGAKVESAIDKTAAKIETKYNQMKVAVLDHKGGEAKFIETNLNPEHTATGLIGKTITNSNGERIGTLEDIIVDGNGVAKTAIVADGDFAGIGKKAAFDYSSVINTNKKGDVVASISEQDIKAAKKFSYDAKDSANGSAVIPAGSYSVKELLDADVKTSSNNLDLDVENLTFNGNKAEYFVVEADNDKTKKDSYAAISFSDVKMLSTDDENEFDVQLSAATEQSLLAHISTAAQ